MSLSMYQASVPVFVMSLKAMVGILDKAEAHCTAKKIDPAVMLGLRLSPDMFAFTRQLQIATDFAKGASARLAGVEPPAYDDKEASFADLKARIHKTIEYISALKPAQIDGSEQRDITIKIAGVPNTFKGQPYLVHFALPNFFFHLTTAYAILRASGVDVGKGDFLTGARELGKQG
jgi:uncharacterized protein